MLPPAPGTTPHAGVTVRYLSRHAAADADGLGLARERRGRLAGRRLHLEAAALRHRQGARARLPALPAPRHINVRMPRRQAGLYTLVVRSGAHSAAVPLVASQAGRAGRDGARAGRAADAHLDRATRRSTTAATACPTRCRAATGVALDRPLVDGPPAEPRRRRDAARLPDCHHLTATSSRPTSRSPRARARRSSTAGACSSPTARTSCRRRSAPTLTRIRARRRPGAGARHRHAAGHQPDQRLPRRSAAPRAPLLTKTDLFGAQRGPLTPTGGELITELADDAQPLRRRRRVQRLQPVPADRAAGGRASVGCRDRQRLTRDRRLPLRRPARSSRSACRASARASRTTSTRRSCWTTSGSCSPSDASARRPAAHAPALTTLRRRWPLTSNAC